MIGTDAFQEADISGITMPITKHNYLVRNGDDIPRVIAEAFHIAASGRPGPRARRHPQGHPAGPVHVQLAADDGAARLQAERASRTARQIREAAKLIAAARKPVLYVGGGVIRGEATASCWIWPS